MRLGFKIVVWGLGLGVGVGVVYVLYYALKAWVGGSAFGVLGFQFGCWRLGFKVWGSVLGFGVGGKGPGEVAEAPLSR